MKMTKGAFTPNARQIFYLRYFGEVARARARLKACQAFSLFGRQKICIHLYVIAPCLAQGVNAGKGFNFLC
jgi:hypothetical protein